MGDSSHRSSPDGSNSNGGERIIEPVLDKSGEGHLKSRVIKRSLVVGGHKTSVSLEDVFWNELRLIAHDRRLHLSQLVGSIDSERQHCNLSSAIRLFVFEHSRHRPDDEPGQPEPLLAAVDPSRPRRT